MSHAGSHKRSTIYDVARRAEVSYQTVSRVINNNPNVSAQTRSRVLKAIQDLDYWPNKAAQVLNTQRSHLIEVLALDIYASSPSIDMISWTAKQADYKVIISVVHANDLEKTLEDAHDRSVDGFLFIASGAAPGSVAIASMCEGVPFVRMIDALESNAPSVIYDQRHGAQLATQHLIDLGHTQIAHLIGKSGNVDAQARYESWLFTLQRSALNPGPTAVGNFTSSSGYEAAQKILCSGEPFTAIFAANDEMAIGAMSALSQHGLRVPEDVSIVGFDDAHFSAFTHPPLTTVRQDWRVMARLATEYLIEQIEKPDTLIYQRVLMPELVIRQSTRCISG